MEKQQNHQFTGSRSTLEFPSRVPNCPVSPGHWATRLTRSDFRLNLLLLKGQKCVSCSDTNLNGSGL